MVNNRPICFIVHDPIGKKNNMAYAKGRVYKNKKASSFEDEVFVSSKNAIHREGWETTSNAVKVEIQYNKTEDTAMVWIHDLNRPAPKRRKDISNLADLILDVLEAPSAKNMWKSGIYHNDRQVVELVIKEAR